MYTLEGGGLANLWKDCQYNGKEVKCDFCSLLFIRVYLMRHKIYNNFALGGTIPRWSVCMHTLVTAPYPQNNNGILETTGDTVQFLMHQCHFAAYFTLVP